jgi:soluble lytic murein transglycosylase-like protein
MQESLDYRNKRKKLHARYKRELLRRGTDDRLNPRLIMAYGYKYFASMMADYGGDISFALAAYNAGPHRVRQFNGIPPYAETVAFRNRVMGYYRDYLGKLKK